MAVFLKYEGERKTTSNKTEFMIADPPIGQKVRRLEDAGNNESQQKRGNR